MVSILAGYDPTTDRFDRDRAELFFRTMWPNPVVEGAVAVELANSIQIAHDAGVAAWEVTLLSQAIRLNVGQVETLTLGRTRARFLFRSPLVLDEWGKMTVELSDDPYYPAVPIPSGVCVVPVKRFSTFPQSIRDRHHEYIRAAASFKSVSPFKRSFSPSVLEHLEHRLGVSLPRPSYFKPTSKPKAVPTLPDKIDTSAVFIEGAKKSIVVNAYERSEKARLACIAAHGTVCSCCDMEFGTMYGPIAAGYIHVHHTKPLSEIGEEYDVDPVEHLRPVCPNCHAVAHLRTPPFSIDQVMAMLATQVGLRQTVGGQGVGPREG